jgi:hypothetical protein
MVTHRLGLDEFERALHATLSEPSALKAFVAP